MDANQQENKIEKREDKIPPFKCPITYINELPDPIINCKFLPCGKSLMDYSEDPISFPQLEAQFNYNFKGLHTMFDVDLINPNCYTKVPGEQTEMGPKDVALFTDIEEQLTNNSKVKGSYNFPIQAQEFCELFAKKRSTVPRLHLEPKSEELDLDSLSVEQQIQIVEQTFVDIDRPLGAHPTKSNSSVRPVAQLPVFPESIQQELVQANFAIPPVGNTNSILKDCGCYYINFKQNPEPVFQRINQKYGKTLNAFLSEQRFKEEPISELDQLNERFILREKDGSLYYQTVSQYIKLRTEIEKRYCLSYLSLLVQRNTDKPRKPEKTSASLVQP
ncbi:hypothetical protein AWZ03_008469 [Drosophila navojoa]|uniref:Uncharacterized protein n=1 Tax=Drosophila navojoa TaxID=7232 RepID=A0A484BBE2_DRONA|nr:uncharacterized protein LOC115563237 [Drosophila navojoa]TDG45131.1 hypothetical protein AWZ03_008469 [Drosophila navojoa]